MFTGWGWGSFRCIYTFMFTMGVCSFQVYSHFDVHQGCVYTLMFARGVFLSGVFTL